MSGDAKLRAAIIGGGMGGLAAAVALRRRGMEVTIFEQSSALGEVGAGVFMYPNSLRQLERMGFGERLASVGGKIGPGSRYNLKDGSYVGDVLTTDSAGWNGMYGMHRADILDTLAAALPPQAVRTGHRAVDFSQDDAKATVRFANGESFEAEIIIAADGINSAMQPFVVEPSLPEYSGFRAYRGLIARDKLGAWPADTHQIWMGDGKHFMTFPVRSGTLYNYVGFVPTPHETLESWSAIGDRDELAASFADWDPRVTNLLAKVETCFWWGLFDRQPLRTWTNGRLALLGDAAHPMLPHLGQGMNQAVEDAVALGVLLEGRESGDVPAVLRAYESLRRPRTSMIQAEARQNGKRYDSDYDSIEQRDEEIRKTAIAFRKGLYDYDIEAAARAFNMP